MCFWDFYACCPLVFRYYGLSGQPNIKKVTMRNRAEILDDFIERLKAENLLIVDRDALRRIKNTVPMSTQQRYLMHRALSFRQIAEGNLWGNVGPARVRDLAGQMCHPDELIDTRLGESRTMRKVTIEGVKRVAKCRGIIFEN